MKTAEIRELGVDELRTREKDLDDQIFRLRIQKSMGQLEAPAKVRELRRDLAQIKTILREKQRDVANMSVKAQLTGTVVSDKMEKTVVVAVERQVRHEVYGKTQRKTSKFVAHNENNEAKVGDTRRTSPSRARSAAASAGS